MDLEDKTLAEFAENDLRELWDTDFYAVSSIRLYFNAFDTLTVKFIY